MGNSSIKEERDEKGRRKKTEERGNERPGNKVMEEREKEKTGNSCIWKERRTTKGERKETYIEKKGKKRPGKQIK